MSGWHEGLLAAFDTETTGTDVEQDRIVTAVLDVYDGAGVQVEQLSLLIDPGIEIPKEASDVHGITTERARADGIDPVTGLTMLKYAIDDVWQRKIPIVAFNAPYDFTITDREFRRHLGEPLTLAGPVIDPMVLDKQVDRYVKGSGQRKLGPTCARYGVEITDWHTADADAFAAQALARKIAVKHASQMPSTMQDLWRWQVALRRNQMAELEDYFRRKGDTNDDGTPIVIDGQWPMKKWTDS